LNAVLWDVGGVLVEFAPQDSGRARWREALGFGVADFDQALWSAIGSRGVRDTARIVERIGLRFGLDAADAERLLWESNDHWVPNRPLIEHAVALHESGLRAAIVGNAGAAARWAFEAIVGVLQFTDAVIISAEVGVEKPDARIFQLAVDALDVPASACTFVDDIPQHVEGARSLGIDAFLHSSTEDTIARLPVP
jgi:putative hydrolase of the HAD superfamily